MESLLSVAGGLAGAIAGGVAGFSAGTGVVRGRAWLYWLLNAVGAVAGIAMAAAGLMNDSPFFWIGGLAFLGASLTGLKYGYAKNPGARAVRRGFASRRSGG